MNPNIPVEPSGIGTYLKMDKICIMNQPEGLGDILYTQKIGYHFQDQGYEIYWPVNSSYKDMGEYIRNFNYFDNWPEKPSVCISQGFKEAGLPEEACKVYHQYNGSKGIIHEQEFGDKLIKFVPTNHLQHIEPANPEVMPNPGTIMKRKYAFVGISDHDWQDYLHIDRNEEKENQLFYDILKLHDGEEYALVNTMFGTPGFSSNWQFILENFLASDSGKAGMHRVDLSFIDGYSIFDWMKVIENAKEIWMEGSVIMFLCEKLNLNADKMYVYCRWGYNSPEIQNLFTKPWYAYNQQTHDTTPLQLQDK